MVRIPPFKNKNLFEQAFTHRSFLNEAKRKVVSNERLEFLGDSILSFVVSDFLYKKYPHFPEGALTNLRSLLVNTKRLGSTARELGFGQFLKLSKGEEESKGRENVTLLANSFEAFVGALYLDQGIEKVRSFIYDTLLAYVEEIVRQKSLKDPKSLLQEHVQAKKLVSPTYKVLKEVGPAHAKTFTVGVYVSGKLIAQGEGKSKQRAEEKAAHSALEQTSN